MGSHLRLGMLYDGFVMGQLGEAKLHFPELSFLYILIIVGH